MTRTKSTYLALLTVLLAPMAAQAELTDFGPSGEYFFDTDTGLYWQDIANFLGQTQAEVEAFVAASVIWDLASQAEMEALLGASSQGGVSLTEIMGPRQLAITGGDRWVGFLDVTTVDPLLPGDPNGWLVQTNAAGLSTITATGFQNSVELQTHGAWVNSSVNPAIEPDTTFSIVIIPDTQIYVENHPEIFEAQMDWIVNNKDVENIVYVAHLGDLKDSTTCDNPMVTNGSGDGRTEWEIVDQAFDKLDVADIPYGVLPGNHDFDSIFALDTSGNPIPSSERCPTWDSVAERPLSLYNSMNTFAPSRFAGKPWYGDLTGTGERGNRVDDSNEDNFTLFDGACGINFIAINLAYKEGANAIGAGLGGGAEIDWADKLLKLYPDRLGIVTSHNFLRQNPDIDPDIGRTGNGGGFGGDYGADVYMGLTAPAETDPTTGITTKGPNPNFIMMLSAHKRGEAWRGADQGTFRRDGQAPLHAFLADYQSLNYPADPTSVDFGRLDGNTGNSGDGGFMRIMRFDTDTQMVNVETFAPAVSFLDADDDPYTYNFRPDAPAERTTVLRSDYFPADGTVMDKDTASNFSFSFAGYIADPVCP